MINCKENEVIEENTEDEAYDYMNEEPLEDELEDSYEESENDYCD